METKERNYLWDNIKVLLIFLVVAGHLLEGFRPLEYPAAVSFDYWIYSFHMPAFIFVSGFLSKSYCKNGQVRSEKVAVFIAYYTIFQVLLLLLKGALGNDLKGTSFFDPERGLWYLLAMIFYYLVIPLAEKIPSYVTVGAFMILAVMIGMEPDADTMLSVHRIFVFAPFFFVGYYMSESAVEKLRSIKLPIRLILGAELIACSIFIWVLVGFDNFPISVFYGKDNYGELDTDFIYGSILRVESLVIGFLMIFGLLFVMPAVKNFLSYAGAHSLRVYIFHLPIVVLLMDTKYLSEIKINGPVEFICLILASAAIVALLTIPIFKYPFKWIQLGVHKLYSVKEKKIEE